MSNFEERLLSALKEDIVNREAAPVVPMRRGRGRVLGMAAAATGVAAAALVAMSVYGGATSPAFAVDRDPDGSVEVQINKFGDKDELESKLAAAGIRAHVDYVPLGKACKQPRGVPGGEKGGRTQTSLQGSSVKGGEDNITFKITKGQVAADETLVLTFSFEASEDGAAGAMGMSIVKGEVSPCEQVDAPTPGPRAPGDGRGGNDNGPSFHTGGTDSGGEPAPETVTSRNG